MTKVTGLRPIITNESTIDNCVDVLEKPNTENHLFSCMICGAEAITKGEIVILYATVTKDNMMPYIDIFDKEEDAIAEIGEMTDDGEIVGYIKGYSFKPVGGQYLYDDAPDFCYSVDEAVYEAERLGVELTYYRPTE